MVTLLIYFCSSNFKQYVQIFYDENNGNHETNQLFGMICCEEVETKAAQMSYEYIPRRKQSVQANSH